MAMASTRAQLPPPLLDLVLWRGTHGSARMMLPLRDSKQENTVKSDRMQSTGEVPEAHGCSRRPERLPRGSGSQGQCMASAAATRPCSGQPAMADDTMASRGLPLGTHPRGIAASAFSLGASPILVGWAWAQAVTRHRIQPGPHTAGADSRNYGRR